MDSLWAFKALKEMHSPKPSTPWTDPNSSLQLFPASFGVRFKASVFRV